VETVKTVLNSSGISGNLIALEITESALMSSFDRSINKLLELKDLGLKLYLDDFGTGYSSLNYLKNLPIDTVKIDKSFVRDLADNLLEVDLLSSIIGLVNRLGLNVVAEGIETQEQVEFLQNCRCHFGQGFLFSKPVPQNEVIKIITQKNDLEKCGMNGFLKD
jgi:EAL domain-containing protein (putative c-di-GMP-specific phosphodiesterase class I)